MEAFLEEMPVEGVASYGVCADAREESREVGDIADCLALSLLGSASLGGAACGGGEGGCVRVWFAEERGS